MPHEVQAHTGCRTYCPRLAEEIGERTALEEAILRLPGKVLAEAREAELAQAVADTMLKGGLFPGPFQSQEPAAKLWVLLWRVSAPEVRVYPACKLAHACMG